MVTSPGWPKPRRRRRSLPPPHKTQNQKKHAIFLCLRLYRLHRPLHLDHGYITLGYLDMDINDIIYSYTHRQ
jgi:hypothetical protein